MPLTSDGNIIVDGVLASCYASFDHDLAHLFMTPMQWFPGTLGWIFGEGIYEPGYVTYAQIVGRVLAPYGLIYDKSYV